MVVFQSSFFRRYLVPPASQLRLLILSLVNDAFLFSCSFNVLTLAHLSLLYQQFSVEVAPCFLVISTCHNDRISCHRSLLMYTVSPTFLSKEAFSTVLGNI